MRKILAYLMIIAGVALIVYWSALVVESKLDQRKLIDQFNKAAQSQTVAKAATTGWPPTILEIPRIGLRAAVNDVADQSLFSRKLSAGPGHYPGTALPGAKGNVAIAGHRTGPAGYFRNLDRLAAGDTILLLTPGRSYLYRVEQVFVVEKDDWSVVNPTPYPALTLTTCEAVGLVSNAKRLIVRARLVPQ